MDFDLDGARKAGFSEGQIADALAKQSDFDLEGARAAGYDDATVIPHLMKRVGGARPLPANVTPSIAGGGRGTQGGAPPGAAQAYEAEQAQRIKTLAQAVPADAGGASAIGPEFGGEAPVARAAPAPVGGSVFDQAAARGERIPEVPLSDAAMNWQSIAPAKQQEILARERYQQGFANAPEMKVSKPGLADRAQNAVLDAGGTRGMSQMAGGAVDTALLVPEAVFTTGKIGADIANLATLGLADPVSKWLGDTITAIQNDKSGRYQQQKAQMGQLLKDESAGVADVIGFLASNPRFAAETGIPSVPSALVGAGGGRVLGALAQGSARAAGKSAAATEAAMLSGQRAGMTGTNVLMNAGGTFSDTSGDTMNRLGAAGVAGAGTFALGRLGGAEAALLQGARGNAISRVGKTALTEGLQESGESMSQALGKGAAEENFDLSRSLKQAALEGGIGAGIGGGAGLISGGAPQQPAQTTYDTEALARSKGFLRPTEQRRAINDKLDDVAAEHGLPKSVIDAAKKKAETMPLAEVPGFFRKYAAAIGRRLGRDPDAVAAGFDEAPPNVPRETPPAAADLLNTLDGMAAEGQTDPNADLESRVAAGLGIRTEVDDAAHGAATSPENELTLTLAQELAGNHKMGHFRISGMPISVSHAQGSTRRGVSADGTAWESQMLGGHYGSINGTTSADGANVDVVVAPGTRSDYSGPVYVVDQIKPDSGKFDEPKALVGYSNQAQAEAGYMANYPPGWQGMGAITQLPMPAFKAWAKSKQTRKPLGDLTNAARTASDAGQPAPDTGRSDGSELLRSDAGDVVLDARISDGPPVRGERADALRPDTTASADALTTPAAGPAATLTKATDESNAETAPQGGQQARGEDGVQTLRAQGSKEGPRKADAQAQVTQSDPTPPEVVWNGKGGKGMARQALPEHRTDLRKKYPNLEFTAVEAPEFGDGRWKLEGRKKQAVTAAPPTKAATTQGPANENDPAPPRGGPAIDASNAASDAAQASSGRTRSGPAASNQTDAAAPRNGEGADAVLTNAAAQETDAQGLAAQRAPAVTVSADPVAAAPDEEVTAAEIAAIQDIPTVDVMREAIAAVGEQEFERRAQQRINDMTRGGKFKEPSESSLIEAEARKTVALARRAEGRKFTNSLARTASWVIRDKATGAVVMETFDKAKVDALNTAKYEAVPVQEHLASLSNKPAPKARDADTERVIALKKRESVLKTLLECLA